MELRDRLNDLNVELPEGRVVELAGEDAFWISTGSAPTGLWAALRLAHATSGLWPVLVREDRAWWEGSSPESVDYVDQYDPDDFMAETWDYWVESHADEGYELLAPFGEHCPGLTAAGEEERDPDSVADMYAGLLEVEGVLIALVPVERSADALVAMGWEGAATHADTVPLTALLRSWEERFGARLVQAGATSLNLSVGAPPVVDEHALHVAAEHWVFCPDNVEQNAGTLSGYGERIQEKIAWPFRWA
ncbi:DUF4253 domain-containing protein [Umezawaea beigongshangensis]|uniref:DUF4253 domain-containing protein n=1 Tax=Umezawaea beigongshangensis TaxID=2780383 RepID=UPI0018F1A5ED|nr:DUF4253 domain-containing protein [Umezawaea beigongshangensis]